MGVAMTGSHRHGKRRTHGEVWSSLLGALYGRHAACPQAQGISFAGATLVIFVSPKVRSGYEIIVWGE